jgi:AbrB family looped-hinge helix DNA binding protein
MRTALGITLNRLGNTNMSTTVTVKGQVTIPKPIRDRLGLRPGDRVAFEFDDAGRLLVRKTVQVIAKEVDRFERLKGQATAGLTTDEIIAMTRGED